jgi:hypothetical protein
MLRTVPAISLVESVTDRELLSRRFTLASRAVLLARRMTGGEHEQEQARTD